MERVCHKTIYQALYVQGRGGLRRELAKQLSTGRIQRKPRGTVDGRGKLYREAFTIAERPAIVEDRAVPGHWEGDLVVGTANGSAVGTLVERTTRFVMLLHIPGRHDADSVAEAMIKQMGKPRKIYTDQEPGMVLSKKFSQWLTKEGILHITTRGHANTA